MNVIETGIELKEVIQMVLDYCVLFNFPVDETPGFKIVRKSETIPFKIEIIQFQELYILLRKRKKMPILIERM